MCCCVPAVIRLEVQEHSCVQICPQLWYADQPYDQRQAKESKTVVHSSPSHWLRGMQRDRRWPRNQRQQRRSTSQRHQLLGQVVRCRLGVHRFQLDIVSENSHVWIMHGNLHGTGAGTVAFPDGYGAGTTAEVVAKVTGGGTTAALELETGASLAGGAGTLLAG